MMSWKMKKSSSLVLETVQNYNNRFRYSNNKLPKMKQLSDDLDLGRKRGHKIKVTLSLHRGFEIVTVSETMHCDLRNCIENLNRFNSTILEHNRYSATLNSYLHI